MRTWAPPGTTSPRSDPTLATDAMIRTVTPRRTADTSCFLQHDMVSAPPAITSTDAWLPSIMAAISEGTLPGARWWYLLSFMPRLLRLSSFTFLRLDMSEFMALTLFICSWIMESKASSGAMAVQVMGFVPEMVASFFFWSF